MNEQIVYHNITTWLWPYASLFRRLRSAEVLIGEQLFGRLGPPILLLNTLESVCLGGGRGFGYREREVREQVQYL